MKQQKGFIALISILIISAILLIITTTLSLTSFFAQFDMLEHEFKEKSKAHANACVNIAKLRLVQNALAPEVVTISGSDTCEIESISNSGNQITLRVHADYKNAITRILLTLSTIDGSIVSLQEVSHF